MKQLWINILSISAVAAFFTPLLLVALRRLWKDPFFLIFAAYWAGGGLLGLTDYIPSLAPNTRQTIGTVYNMMDVPVILAIFYFTTTSLPLKRFTSLAFSIYVILEIWGVATKGLNYDALKYPLAAGILLVLVVVITEIVRYLQKVEHNHRQNAKVLIYAAVLFEYLTYILIYIFDYFTDKPVYDEHKQDIYLIYYLSTLVGIMLASCGYLLYKKLQADEPLKNEIKINII